MTAPPQTSQERRALLALWALPGVGVRAIKDLADRVGPLGGLLPLAATERRGLLPLSEGLRERLRELKKLELLAERVEERAARGNMRITYRGDPSYPQRLAEAADAPPVLFVRGEVGGPRRWVALVGTTFDEVLMRAQMRSSNLTSALTQLELAGLAIQHPGNRYERI
jgi:DNA processing protein